MFKSLKLASLTRFINFLMTFLRELKKSFYLREMIIPSRLEIRPRFGDSFLKFKITFGTPEISFDPDLARAVMNNNGHLSRARDGNF